MTSCPEILYSEFGDQMQRACGKQRIPLSGSIEVQDEAVLASCESNTTAGPFGIYNKCNLFIFTCPLSAS